MVLAITVYTEAARAKGFTMPEPDFYAESSQLADWSQSAEHANAEVQDFSAPSRSPAPRHPMTSGSQTATYGRKKSTD